MNKEDIVHMAKNEYGIYAFTADSLTEFANLVAAEKEKQIFDILERLQERNSSHNYYAYAINVITGNI